MLKIVATESSGGEVMLHLEGQVIGAWVEELRQTCVPILARGVPLALDLSTVSFVNREGVGLLGCLRDRRVALLNCSGLVAEQLKAQEG
jgi:anti-anti-sigma regulatory factor